MTAANADDFLLVPPGGERRVALAMLKVIVEKGWAKQDLGEMGRAAAALAGPVDGVPQERIEGLAKAFVEARASVALPGPDAGLGPAARDTALAVALLNYAAGRIGQTVDFSRPHALSSAATHDQVSAALSGLTADDVLIIHNANPAHTLPGTADGIRKAGTVVYLGTMLNETAALADWVLPIDSPLELWGDYEPTRGYHSLMQPTMARLYDTRSAGDVLLAVASAAGRPLARAAGFEEWLRQRWDGLRERLAPQAEPSAFWQEALRRGGVWEDAPAGEGAQPSALRPASFSQPPAGNAAGDADLWLWPSIFLYDGRTANRGWMQEAPEPVSYAAWGSLIDIHPGLASKLGIADGDVVELKNDRGAVEAPVRVTEDVAPGVTALAFGQGHTKLGRNADGRGANAFLLLDAAAGESGFGRAAVRRTGRRAEPAYASTTQEQHGRKVVQWAALSGVRAMKPGEGDRLIMPLPEGYDRQRDFYPVHPYQNHRWAMAVDLQRCIGCGACAAACYAENNLAVTGESEVRKGREMAWIKVVPYRNQEDARRLGFIPLMCQQCDAAPCEPVCPVFASVHDDEGLNNQVYNRCIGTRYCSNNCPYKVRHFNWFNHEWVKPLDLQLNPDVTVRCRGVMEKCTFCVQRIRRVEYRAKAEGRPVHDGEIQPACVQTCPTRALIFGDLMSEEAEVTRLTRRDPRRYHLLEELNTKPAVAYLRRILRDVEA
jgi:molybdopterin-containing oxidoreductase family iron-sulfur binding subunit